MTKTPKFLVVLSIIILVCLGLLVLETQTRIFRRAFDNYIMDNKNHYLSCEQLPTVVEVNRVIQEHRNMVEAIENINPGYVGVEIDTTTCPGKADLLI